MGTYKYGNVNTQIYLSKTYKQIMEIEDIINKLNNLVETKFIYIIKKQSPKTNGYYRVYAPVYGEIDKVVIEDDFSTFINDKFDYLDRNSITRQDYIIIKEGDPLWKPLLLDLIDYYKDKLNRLNDYVKDLLTPKEEN